jgi:hypothetical protein
VSAVPAEPMGAAMTVVFDSATSWADVPNLLAYHPGKTALHGWLTYRLAPIAVKKRLKPGWHVTFTSTAGTAGALCDRHGKPLLSFEIVKGHRL